MRLWEAAEATLEKKKGVEMVGGGGGQRGARKGERRK